MNPDADDRLDRSDLEQPAPSIDHVTVENDDAPDECALFPANASEEELTTTWISAQEGSYVDLESAR